LKLYPFINYFVKQGSIFLKRYLVLQDTKRSHTMSIRSQLLKGLLDGCVLSVISKEPVYGYELSKKLQAAGLKDVSEGTIYPVLLRLQKNRLITGQMKPSESGPNRKYYTLTEEGLDALEMISKEWEQISFGVNSLLKGRNIDA
jgi:PadR family transcriptional regulator, regulatory protein PadR